MPHDRFLKNLGVVKEPILIAGILAFFLIASFATPLCLSDDTLRKVSGLGMMFFGIVIIGSCIAFYAYAYIKGLPSNRQEVTFEASVKKQIPTHQRRMKELGVAVPATEPAR